MKTQKSRPTVEPQPRQESEEVDSENEDYYANLELSRRTYKAMGYIVGGQPTSMKHQRYRAARAATTASTPPRAGTFEQAKIATRPKSTTSAPTLSNPHGLHSEESYASGEQATTVQREARHIVPQAMLTFMSPASRNKESWRR
jgi:hypothetical protein